jgi:dolichol-phosphate mannosyltransferase
MFSARVELPARFAATACATTRRKAVRFGLVGGSGVVVNSGALYALHVLLHLPVVAASGAAAELAIASNFLLNDHWTFTNRCLSVFRFARFNLAAVGGLVVNTVTVWAMAGRLGAHYLLANLVGIALASSLNFALSANWVWRPSRAS